MNFKDIRLLADENVSPRVVTYLRNRGIDILDVKEMKWYGREDAELLETAYKENRFILTHDSDFGTLAIYEGKRCYDLCFFVKLKC